jgi:hypothetical protein
MVKEILKGSLKSIALIISIFIIVGFLILNPQIFNFSKEEKKGCVIENEIKDFLSKKAKAYLETFPYAGLDSGFPIGYERISENYSVCYFSNFVCKKSGNIYNCKGAIMPFEIFCFKYESFVVCLKEFSIDENLQVTSLACEVAPEQVSKYYC